ncbi:peptidoglycan editing factor PgeF [Pseudoalteromonas sp. XMcav11-Q]|uniref:peptidoglycan editing factor PgeF n=1 Tax=Pseudoalteromonas sp. XMcav11-Q TaxID=3136665 RepID=UPI0032C3FCFC
MQLAQWPLTQFVGTLSTTRKGGVSAPPYDSFNLAFHVGDNAEQVAENRRILHGYVANPIVWLEQVHGAEVVVVDEQFEIAQVHQADALYTRLRQTPLAIMTADCLPILLASKDGEEVAAIHGGWKPLAAGIISQTLAKFNCAPEEICVWFGPAIGPSAFEVGEDVVQAFEAQRNTAFVAKKDGKYLADIFELAQSLLCEQGVKNFYGDKHCTVTMSEQYFSYRRDKTTGRMATLIWRK